MAFWVHKSAEKLVRENLCRFQHPLLLSLELCSVLLLDHLISFILKCQTGQTELCLKPNTVKYCDACLSQRLKNWEIRERKKARDYSKETEREEERHREMVRIN